MSARRALLHFDAFRSLPDDLAPPTLFGSAFTVFAGLVCSILLTCELRSYLTVSEETFVQLEQRSPGAREEIPETDHLLKIAFDVDMHML